MQYFFQMLRQYRWSIGLGLLVFIICLLILNFGIGVTLLVFVLTALAVVIGFMKDRNISFSDLIKNIR